MTSCFPLQSSLRMTYTTGLLTFPQGDWSASSSSGNILGGSWARSGCRHGDKPQWGRFGPARQIGVVTSRSASSLFTLALGSPRPGGHKARLLVHTEKVPPLFAEGAPRRQGHPRGSSTARRGRRSHQTRRGGGVGRQEAAEGAARRGVPALARRRGWSLKRLQDVCGQAVRRRMLPPMGLTVAREAPINNAAPGSLPFPAPPNPAWAAPGVSGPSLGAQTGVRSPRCSPACRRAQGANTDPVPESEAAAGKMPKPLASSPPPEVWGTVGGQERNPRGSDRGTRLCPTALAHVAT